ncbi:Antiseptic resistance protein [Brevibacterium casei]|uniref:Antiseptic resistance protein n=2 Tax=Brevibacterium casei TaxID=33889 RepID=A0A449DB78_9MICO|nr:Antiseptic resistance protein [Brevibacterium casei]
MSAEPTASPPARATGRSWVALGLLTMPVLLMSIDLTVLAVAVPHLSEDLSPSAAQLLWIVDVYGIFLAGLLILMGSLGDRIGRRRLLLIGSVLFGLASAIAAFSTSPEMLIAARALLGIGGATLMPSTLSLIRNIFADADQRRRAISVWAAAFAGGAGLGPIVGGAILEHFDWGAVFLINVPLMVVLVIAGPFLLPESKDPKPGRFDLASALLLIIAVLAFVYGLKHAAEYGWGWSAVAFLLAGLAGGVWFALRQRRLAAPLVDITLFKSLPFSVAVLANVAGVFALVTVLYFFPQYIQLVLDKTPLEAGVWALPIAGGAILGAILAPILARKIAVGWLIGLGLTIAAGGYTVLTGLGVEEAMALAFTGGALIGGGVGLADTLTNDVIIATAPPNRAAAAAGISETAYELGGALGIAILGSFGTSIYRAEVETASTGLPAEAVDAAKETLGAAHMVAEQLPDDASGGFLAMVDEAFTTAMTDTFVAGGIILAITAIAAAAVLRTRRARNDAP